MGNYTIFQMFENLRRGRQERNFTTNNPKILDLKSSSEQIFSRKLPLGAPEIQAIQLIYTLKFCTYNVALMIQRKTILISLYLFLKTAALHVRHLSCERILNRNLFYLHKCTEFFFIDFRKYELVSNFWLSRLLYRRGRN